MRQQRDHTPELSQISNSEVMDPNFANRAICIKAKTKFLIQIWCSQNSPPLIVREMISNTNSNNTIL